MAIEEQAAEAEVLAVLQKLEEVEKRWSSLPMETREQIRRQNPDLAWFFANVNQQS